MGEGQGGGKQIGAGYTIRLCRSHQELRNCVKLQKRIWGLEDRELYPERIFVVTNKIGGAVLGAFDPQGQPAGFLIYIPDHYGQLLTNQRAGLHTDRFEIEWRLRSARVRRAVGGGKGKVSPAAVQAEVALPLDVWKTAGRNLKAARAEQFRLRREFLRHFSRGLAVTRVWLGESEAFYLLESYED